MSLPNFVNYLFSLCVEKFHSRIYRHSKQVDVSICKSQSQAIAFEFGSVQSRGCRRFGLRIQFFRVQHEYV